MHRQDQAASRVEASVVVLVAHAVASEAASVATEEVLVATEEVSVDEEGLAIKVEAGLEEEEDTVVNPMALALARHPLRMLHLVQVVVAAAALDLVGMVEVRTAAHR